MNKMEPNTKPCPECGEPIGLDEDICEDCALADDVTDDEDEYEDEEEFDE
jgi:NMD protein affecting ribosome stability and mRNA decay